MFTNTSSQSNVASNFDTKARVGWWWLRTHPAEVYPEDTIKEGKKQIRSHEKILDAIVCYCFFVSDGAFFALNAATANTIANRQSLAPYVA